MESRLNLSRRDAWLKVSEYVGLWLIFFLLVGFLGYPGASLDRRTLPGALLVERSAVPEPVAKGSRISDALESESSVAVAAASLTTDPLIAQRDARSSPAVARLAGNRSASDRFVSDENAFTTTAPAGFADLLGVQNTQADVYFQGQLLLASFVEYDLEQIWFLAPQEIVDAIPTLKNPAAVLAVLSTKLDSHSQLLCNARVRENCGSLEPAVAGVIFDESRFRIDLFVNEQELEVQMLVGDRYLPAPTADWATLHDLSLSASGQFGDDRFSMGGESYLSKGQGRFRVRYGLTNAGAALHEASWQWDRRDREVELGAFRSARGSSLFVNDLRLLGLRIGSSTKTRTDLDNALATPVFVFLERRSRVDVLRDGEILDSRFYDAGNHQLDTTRLPDGAYDITVRSTGPDGKETRETHFFVRDSLLPPLGESQWYLEAGAFTEPYGSNLPGLAGGAWVRSGLGRRLSDNFGLEGEVLVAGDINLLQSGAYVLGRGWQVHAGLLASDRGDAGYSLRSVVQRKGYSLSFSLQHLESQSEDSVLARFDPLLGSNVELDAFNQTNPAAVEQQVLNGSYTQASAALSFPLSVPLFNGKRSAGRAHLRARYNRRNGRVDKGIGINYYAPLFKRRNMAAELNLEGLYSNNRSLVRIGFDLRWRDRGRTSVVRPELLATHTPGLAGSRSGNTVYNPGLSGYWNRNRRSERLGDVVEGFYVNHDNAQSVFGSRIVSQSNYGFADLDVSWRENHNAGGTDGMAYTANSRFSLVSTSGKSAIGGGANQLAAIVVEIDGELPDAEFEIIVDNRVAGYATSSRRGVVSARPYEVYEVKIRPVGAQILGYDERSYEVSLFPGNVHRLTFAARALHVLVSQALLPDGSPVRYGKFENVEGYGATDEDGWFQVEIAHREALQLRLSDGGSCWLHQPPAQPQDDSLAVVDALVCRAEPVPDDVTQAPRSN